MLGVAVLWPATSFARRADAAKERMARCGQPAMRTAEPSGQPVARRRAMAGEWADRRRGEERRRGEGRAM